MQDKVVFVLPQEGVPVSQQGMWHMLQKYTSHVRQSLCSLEDTSHALKGYHSVAVPG